MPAPITRRMLRTRLTLRDLATASPEILDRLKLRIRVMRLATEETEGPCPVPHWFEAAESLPDTDPLQQCALEFQLAVLFLAEHEGVQPSEGGP